MDSALATPRSLGGMPARVGASSSIDRDGWWKSSLKSTPNPGTYQPSEIPLTGSTCAEIFKVTSREKHFVHNIPSVGILTQPAMYHLEDSMQESARRQCTYSFRALSRDTWGAHMVGHEDKQLNLAPGMYEENIPPGTQHSHQPRSANFLSCSPRLPTPLVQTHLYTRHVYSPGPGPTSYVATSTLCVEKPGSMCTSNMGSRTPRFASSKRAVGAKIGPGSYTNPTPTIARTQIPLHSTTTTLTSPLPLRQSVPRRRTSSAPASAVSAATTSSAGSQGSLSVLPPPEQQ